MQKSYFNYMLEAFLNHLSEMVTINEKTTMIQYKTMPISKWKKKESFIEALYITDGKKTPAMIEYADKLYPVLKSAIILKQGFKKLAAIKIDDYDFRMIITNLRSLLY